MRMTQTNVETPQADKVRTSEKDLIGKQILEGKKSKICEENGQKMTIERSEEEEAEEE